MKFVVMKARKLLNHFTEVFRGRARKTSNPLADRSEAEMLSNASVIAAIGTLDTTSPFSSRQDSNLGDEEDKDIFNQLTDALIANVD